MTTISKDVVLSYAYPFQLGIVRRVASEHWTSYVVFLCGCSVRVASDGSVLAAQCACTCHAQQAAQSH
jgi:hypothetical protein